jgi:hypothetical protein
VPLVGWIHPLTREHVPLDYDWSEKVRDAAGGIDERESVNGRAPVAAWTTEYWRQREAEDVRHKEVGMSVTRFLTCPREVFLKLLLPYHENPARAFGMLRGAALHDVAAKYWPKQHYITEANHPDLLTVRGELFGVQVSGRADAARVVQGKGGPRIVELLDDKYSNDSSAQFRKRDRGIARPDYMWQLNALRKLFGQQEWCVKAGYDPEDVTLTLWEYATFPGEGPEPMDAGMPGAGARVPLMTDAQMLAHKPGGGQHTVAEIAAQFEAARIEYAEELNEQDREALCSRLQLIGKSMFNSKKCLMYCAVEPVCSRLARQYGEPRVE